MAAVSRSFIMSKIRSSKTTPELKVRPILKLFGFTYQPKGIYGKPDFANRVAKIAIFIDGCFWHGCKVHYNAPTTNSMYWRTKIKRNIKRDSEVNAKLKFQGWRIIRIWEHDIPN
jgi:DNA mismatch endonuclease (patch repair protein)